MNTVVKATCDEGYVFLKNRAQSQDFETYKDTYATCTHFASSDSVGWVFLNKGPDDVSFKECIGNINHLFKI